MLQLQVNLRCTCRASLGQRMHCAALHCNASQSAHRTPADMHNPCRVPASIMHKLHKHAAYYSLKYAVQITLTSGWSRTSSDCPAVVLHYTTLVYMQWLQAITLLCNIAMHAACHAVSHKRVATDKRAILANGRGESTIPPPFHLLARLRQRAGGSGQTHPAVYIHCANSSPGTEQCSYMQRTIPNANSNSIPVTCRSNIHKPITSTGEEATFALTVGSVSIPPTDHPA